MSLLFVNGVTLIVLHNTQYRLQTHIKKIINNRDQIMRLSKNAVASAGWELLYKYVKD